MLIILLCITQLQATKEQHTHTHTHSNDLLASKFCPCRWNWGCGNRSERTDVDYLVMTSWANDPAILAKNDLQLAPADIWICRYLLTCARSWNWECRHPVLLVLVSVSFPICITLGYTVVLYKAKIRGSRDCWIEMQEGKTLDPWRGVRTSCFARVLACAARGVPCFSWCANLGFWKNMCNNMEKNYLVTLRKECRVFFLQS